MITICKVCGGEFETNEIQTDGGNYRAPFMICKICFINNEGNYNEATLPKWAQKRLENMRHVIGRLEGLRSLHALLAEKRRSWFTLQGPPPRNKRETTKLWILDADNPYAVCTLGKGDILFIGKASKV